MCVCRLKQTTANRGKQMLLDVHKVMCVDQPKVGAANELVLAERVFAERRIRAIPGSVAVPA